MRFSGFTEEWEVKKLGEVATISSGGTPSRSNLLYWNGNIPWVSTTLIDFNFIEKSEEYITEAGLKNSSAKLFPKGTLIMAMYGQGKTRGKIAVLNIEAATNQACGAILTNKNILDSLFAFQNLTKRYDEIRDLSNQGGQENLSGGIIKGIEITFPNLEEQNKIVSFLTLTDNRITTQKKIIEELKLFKNSTAKKIFSQQLRFKDEDGNDFPDWEIKKLEGVCEVARSGGTPTSTNKSYYDGNIPFLSISDMTSQGKYLTKTDNTISKLGLENSASWLVPKYSLIYSMYASVGFVAINKIPIATSQAVLNLILKKEVNLEFMYYTLIDFQKNIAQFITTGTQGNLNAKSVKNFNIYFPSLKEQNRIANFLSKKDEKIELEKELLQKFETQKKYLLSNLFV